MKRIRLGAESERRGVSQERLAEYVRKLTPLINCKTVWTKNGENREEFENFYRLLDELFPNLAGKAEKLTFGTGCFFYIIKGKNAKKNLLLMSHHDVVDGDGSWTTDPFCATVKDGYLYGRGTIDTKTPLFGELCAVEELISEGYDFEGINLYIGSSDNEEVSGDGMLLAAEYFKERGIRFDTVLDEGGAITEGQIPGVSCKSAVVAVHEKSRHYYRCCVKSMQNGHGGFGKAADSAAVCISRFITEVSDSKIYKGKFYPEVRATFSSHVPYMSFPMKLLFGNMTLFGPVIKKIMMGIPAASAMLATGVSFPSAVAVDPEDPRFRAKTGECIMFLRCVREEDLYKGLEKIKKIGEKHGIEIEEIERDFCKPTDFRGEAFKTVEAVLHENFPDVAVAPFLLTAGTDSRRLTDVADNILRFAPIDLNKKQFASIHGADEHIGVKSIGECVVFYKDFIKKYISMTKGDFENE